MTFALLLCAAQPSVAQIAPLPKWLEERISKPAAPYNKINEVEEVTYDGKAAFQVYQGPSDADTGHLLFTNDGKLICQFGGFTPTVAAGECDLHKINYVRTVYMPVDTSVIASAPWVKRALEECRKKELAAHPNKKPTCKIGFVGINQFPNRTLPKKPD